MCCGRTPFYVDSSLGYFATNHARPYRGRIAVWLYDKKSFVRLGVSLVPLHNERFGIRELLVDTFHPNEKGLPCDQKCDLWRLAAVEVLAQTRRVIGICHPIEHSNWKRLPPSQTQQTLAAPPTDVGEKGLSIH